jgi:hypothetical protein
MAPHHDHDSAVAAAETDLAEAFAVKQDGGTDADLAMSLKSKGYVNVTGFKIIKEEGNAEFKSVEVRDEAAIDESNLTPFHKSTL